MITSFIDGIASSAIEAIGRGTPVAITPGTPTSTFVVACNAGVVISSIPNKAASEIYEFYNGLVDSPRGNSAETLLLSKSDFILNLTPQILPFVS